MSWDSRHSIILTSFISNLDQAQIRYFIIRNYEGLPDCNPSKDVDMVIDPSRIKHAEKILKQTYKNNKLTYFYKVRFGEVYCCYGFNLEANISIQIDLIASYVSKGFEIFSFEQLYANTILINQTRVSNKLYEGLMILIYKLFNYKKPQLKQRYKDIIKETYNNYPEFKFILSNLIGHKMADKIIMTIEIGDFDKLLSYSDQFSCLLRIYCMKKHPAKTLKKRCQFLSHKFNRLIFRYNKFVKSFVVVGPDGTGKTTYLNVLIAKIEQLFIGNEKDIRSSIYHFRPEFLPNLGVIAERVKIIKQDRNFTNPHRARQANTISSLIRITYYWLDYLIGWNLYIRRDVKYDRFSVFDRYCYDFIVDPKRTRLNLPLWIRNLFIKCIPQPDIIFFLDASAETIYKRKQELSISEIYRQLSIYRNLAIKNSIFVTINSELTTEEMAEYALLIILKRFTTEL